MDTKKVIARLREKRRQRDQTIAELTARIAELLERIFVTEYQQLMYWCRHCKCYHYVALPTDIEKSGLFGPKMIALTA